MTRCVEAWRCGVPKTVEIRNLDDEVYAALARRAAEAGITVPELLRRHATRLAARPTMSEWLDRTRRRSTDIATDDVLEALDDLRGTWPDAGR
jgi:antitoxin FitA